MIAPVLCLLTLLVGGERRPWTVEIVRQDGDLFATVRAEDAPLAALVDELASELDRRIVGRELMEGAGRATVFLTRRSPDEVLEAVLGLAGLRATMRPGVIEVAPELPDFPTREDLIAAAERAYRSALSRYAAMPGADLARFALGELAEMRGDPTIAAEQFDLVAEEHPDSPLVPEALYRAGVAYGRADRWEDARERLARLANMEVEHGFHALSRLELARALTHLDDDRQALFVLDALEHAYPDCPVRERAQRLLVRARALVGIGQPIDALVALEQAIALDPDLATAPSAMELRAEALEAAGRPADAAAAWIGYAKSAPETAARRALERAADLALEAPDQEIAVILIHGLAEQMGFGRELADELDEARVRLGLDPVGFVDGDPRERLERVESLSQSGVHDEAARIARTLIDRLDQLSEDERLRLALAAAPALDRAEGPEAALALLRRVVVKLDDPEARRRVYVLAGEILERHDRYADAAEAYGGRL